MEYFEKRKQVLSEIFSDFIYNSRKNEFITWCMNPDGCNGNHHKRKLQINIENNVFHCWVCGFSGFITKLLHQHASTSQKNVYLSTIDNLKIDEEEQAQQIEWPDGYLFLLDALDIPEAKESYNWLIEKTGISDFEIFYYKIGFCFKGDYKNRLVFPSFSKEGKLNFYITRDIFKENYKYLNCEGVKLKDFIYNEILIDWEKPIILVEGVKTYLKHSSIDNIIPIFGTHFNEKYLIFKKSILNNVPCVYVALDGEASDKSYNIMDLYHSYSVKTKFVDCKDINQPDEIDTSTFFEKIENSQSFSKKGYLSNKLKILRNNL